MKTTYIYLAILLCVCCSHKSFASKTVTIDLSSCKGWSGEPPGDMYEDKSSRAKIVCVGTGQIVRGDVLTLGELYKCSKDPYSGAPVYDFNMLWKPGYRAPELVEETCAREYCGTAGNKKKAYTYEGISCDRSDHSCKWNKDNYFEKGPGTHSMCTGKYTEK